MKLSFLPLLRALVASVFLAGCRTAPPSGPPISAAREQPGPAAARQDKEASAPYRPAADKPFDLVHTRLEVAFNWEKQHLLGTATIKLRPYFYPQRELQLDAKGFDIGYVGLLVPEPAAKAVKGKKPKAGQVLQEQKLPYTYDGKKLRISLGRDYTRFDTLQLLVEYTAKPNELIKTDSSAEFYNDKGLFFINPLGQEPDKPKQIWTQGETDRNSCWFPTIDEPNQRMTQELYITVEKQYKTLSNGSLIYSRDREGGLRTDYWRLDQPLPPYLTMMAAGDFAVVEDKWRGRPVTYWVEPAYRSTARTIFGRTPTMLEYFSQRLGVELPLGKVRADSGARLHFRSHGKHLGFCIYGRRAGRCPRSA